MPQVKDYLDYFQLQRHPSLFQEDVGLEGVKTRYGTLETHEVIYEIRLNREERGMDFSIRVDTPGRPYSEYWLELDEAFYRGDMSAEPCRFIDASAVTPGADNAAWYVAALYPFAGRERADVLLPMLERVVALLRGRADNLFQIGAMTGRGEIDRLRVFTSSMPRDAVAPFLRELGWRGDLSLVERCLAEWNPFCKAEGYILDFDIFPDGISEKIGINTGPKSKLPQKTDAFLACLSGTGLCLPEKARGVSDWIRTYPRCQPFTQNDVSHFKFAFDASGILDAKAYLRQSDNCFYGGYRAFFRPVQMNLELTTRCPLHCPQCYVSLNTGREIPLDTALYWLRDAAKCGVTNINLSGGETLCYPYLIELIRECKRLSLCSAVALSGAYATEDKLREMIDAGVTEIYISLNGSTEEVNARTRDGYALAIRALEHLRDIGFPEVYVNWVMHSHNADDLENMIALCERHAVKGLVILAFKPDSAHELNSYPTETQLRDAAKTVRKYKGSLEIEAEPCFSQLRALIKNGFLLNTNRGVSRGCGAGRDGISVSAEGRLTPCRHLDVEEEWTSIADYWERSPFLRRLRETEDCRETPCAGCALERYCLPCAAVGMKLHGDLKVTVQR